MSDGITREDYAEWYTANVAKIAACLESPGYAASMAVAGDGDATVEIREWRAQWWRLDDTPVVAHLFSSHHDGVGTTWGVRYVTCSDHDQFSANKTQTDAGELAAWLGLHEIDPDSFQWRPVDYGAKVGRKPGSDIIIPRRDIGGIDTLKGRVN